MSTLRAAKTLWDLCDGRLSNLAMQKLLYLSHMLELGAGRKPLVSRPFEAWNYGPVEPDLYHKLKAYGNRDVPDIFNAPPYSQDDPEYESIADVVDQLGNARAAQLVAITHWDGGAWQKHFFPDRRGIVIPDEDILKELHEIEQRSNKKQTVNQPS